MIGTEILRLLASRSTKIFRRQPFQRFLAALGLGDLVGQPGRLKHPPGRLPVNRIVIYN